MKIQYWVCFLGNMLKTSRFDPAVVQVEMQQHLNPGADFAPAIT